MDSDNNDKNSNSILIDILERQKKDLVVRFLKKHEEVEANKEFYRILEVEENETNLSLVDITCKEDLHLLTEKKRLPR